MPITKHPGRRSDNVNEAGLRGVKDHGDGVRVYLSPILRIWVLGDGRYEQIGARWTIPLDYCSVLKLTPTRVYSGSTAGLMLLHNIKCLTPAM